MPLIAALRDADSDVREHAAGAPGKIKDARAVEPLVATLRDHDTNVSWRAAYALMEIGTPAVEVLIAALRNSDAGVRERAAYTLGKIGDARALPELEHVVWEDRSKTSWGASVAYAARRTIACIRQRKT